MARSAFNTLPPSSKVDIATLALALQGQHGVISELSHEYGIPRQKVYDMREKGNDALTKTFTAHARQPDAFTLEVLQRSLKVSLCS